MDTIPDNANAGCPGSNNQDAGKADACEGCPNQAACASAPKGPDPDIARIAHRLSDVKHVLLVLSGKGGVGKSTVSTQLAFLMAQQGLQVGLLDIDLCGPSVPKLVGLEGQEIHSSGSGWQPVYLEENLAVMSIGFLLPNPDDAVIWRGPRKNGLIKQFLRDVEWNELDILIIDTPPGTSDEHISTVQLLGQCQNVASVVVTTPQEVSIADVRKELNFCKKTGLEVLGVIENMSGLQVPFQKAQFLQQSSNGAKLDVTEQVVQQIQQSCPQLLDLFIHVNVFQQSTGGQKLAEAFKVPFLGSIPMDVDVGAAGEKGVSIGTIESNKIALGALKHILQSIYDRLSIKVDDQ